jgi:hypothetical protein
VFRLTHTAVSGHAARCLDRDGGCLGVVGAEVW